MEILFTTDFLHILIVPVPMWVAWGMLIVGLFVGRSARS